VSIGCVITKEAEAAKIGANTLSNKPLDWNQKINYDRVVLKLKGVFVEGTFN
jgi:hypothetical protein